MSSAAGSLQANSMSAALNDIARLFRLDAKTAAAKAREFLKQYPGQRQGLLLLVSAHRLAGDLGGARAALLEMAKTQPGLAAVHYELALLLIETGERENAIAALLRTVELEPQHAQAWRALGDALAESENAAEANRAYARRIEFAATRLEQLENEAYGEQSRLPRAERVLRARLTRDPTDLSALVLLAGVYIRLGRHADAKSLILQALKLAPEFAPARKLAAQSSTTFTGGVSP